MKKALFPILFFLTLIPALRADEFTKIHGTGVIHIQLDSLGTLDLWESPDDKYPAHSLVIFTEPPYTNARHFSFDGLKKDSFPSWFTPFVFYVNPEVSRLDFNCLEETSLYYKTNLKNASGKYIWVQKSKHVRFFSWFDFYTSVAGVEYIGDTLALYEKPANKSGFFQLIVAPGSKRVQLLPLEIKGSWMRVEIIEEEEGRVKEKKTGWIRWRNEKEPLIKFNLMNC